ncbi:MAG: cytochrome c, partial [Dehalococcoidia bacterium]|nr:cytochrome c [Dehalococcoidia bacterium]
MSRRPVVPALAFVIVLGLALLLIAGIIVRPWEFAAGGSQVNMLAAQSPSGYDRSPLSFVGSTKEVGWAPMYDTDLSGNSGRAYYVQYGCGSCHGLDGKGSSYAPLRVASAEQVLMMVRVGPGGMPVYPKGYLPDEAVKAIAAWLIAQQPSVKPQPTPTPSP